MIVESMNKAEVLRQIATDESWVADRVKGITVKYARQIRFAGLGFTFLGISKYTTPLANTVYIAWGIDKGSKGMSWPVWSSYYQYPGGFIKPLWTNNGSKLNDIMVYSSHSIQRLNERSGIDFMGFVKKTEADMVGKCLRSTYTDREGNEVEGQGFCDEGFFILRDMENGWGKIAVTYISGDISGKDQQELIDDCEADLNEYLDAYTDIKVQQLDSITTLLDRQARRQLIRQ